MSNNFEHISRNACKICGINRFFILEAHNFIKSGTKYVYHFTHSEKYKESWEIITNYQNGNYHVYLQNKRCHQYCFNNSLQNLALYDNKNKQVFELKEHKLFLKETQDFLDKKNNDKLDYKDRQITELCQHISFLRESQDLAIDNLKAKHMGEINSINHKMNKKISKLISDLNNLNVINQNYANQVKDLNKTINENKNLEHQIILNDELKKVNKRLVNLITIYKYYELNTVETYDYSYIKEKNRKLNSEFKRVAKLMKLC